MAQEVDSVVLAANRDGMDALKKGQTKVAFDQFKMAENMLNDQEGGDFAHLLAVTCNNLGSYYKKVGKFHGALSYLRRALKMEVELGIDTVTVAGTHLNICAVLSKLDKHDKALSHAMNALDLASMRAEQGPAEEVPQDDYQILAIAYHNVAVEHDFLAQHAQAAATFRQGFAVAKRHLGEDHPLTVTLGSNCDTMASKSQKQSGKRPGGPVAALRPAHPALPSVPSVLRPTSSAAAAGSIPYPQPALGGGRVLPLLPSARGAAPAQVPAPSSPLTSHDHDDVVNADNTGRAVGKSSKASRDFRPHRMVAGSTRTAKLSRRMLGGSVETANRDRLVAARQTEFKGLAAAKMAYRRKMAAERIQRFWRGYREYCEENSEWMKTTWIAASEIQAVWRSHRARASMRSAAATGIQRILRGTQARERLRRDAAATTVQKLGRGSNARARMRLMRRSGLKITALVRGFLARRRVRRKREHLTQAVLKIQRIWRGFSGRRRAWGVRAVHDEHQARESAAVSLQRSFRGWRGRQRFQQTRQQYLQDVQQYNSAAGIQSQVRRKAAAKRVEGIRADRRHQMDVAATFMRKMWLGYRARRRYRDLKRQFQQQEKHVVTAQRYTRGFLVRNRMWREAVSAEEELWATLEIQRVWRGYLGRARWEDAYEDVWRREMCAALIQRNLRGYLARAEVARRRRKIARAEFERARLRFRSAQRLQALARGVIVRHRFGVRFQRALQAAVCIQRVARGYNLRKALWRQVTGARATVIQANVRGWLVRKRRRLVLAKVIMIQRAYRMWRRLPEDSRAEAARARQRRREKATAIQRRYRGFRESREVGRIQARPAAAGAAAGD